WTIEAVRSSPYSILISEPLLAPENRSLFDAGEDKTRRLVVVDDGLPRHTVEEIRRYFSAHHVATEIIVIPGGEPCKCFDTVHTLIDAFLGFGLNRRTQPIIAFGGGAVLDVTGFAASIYRRGVPFIRVPTTLLAYVDASIGIKTAVNFGRFKNLVG